MSKELTPLQALNKIGEKWTVCWNNGLGHSNQIKELDNYKIIETALKNYEQIKKCHLVAIPRMSNKTSIVDEHLQRRN
jgi:hypothetical protein